jgi:hypothetical protein
MILRAIVERLERRSKHDYEGRHFEGSPILHDPAGASAIRINR